jgi:hypothetical protein
VDEPTPRDDETSSACPSPADEPSPEGEETSSTPGKPVDEPTEEIDKSPVPEPTGSSTEPPKQQRRSNEFWLAVLGVIATMVAGIAGGITTYLTGVEHDKQENVRTQATFTRTAQVQAYNKFLNAITAFDHALRYEYQKIDPPTLPVEQVSQPERDLIQSQQDLFEAAIGLTFYGTTDVMNTLTNVLDATNKLKQALGVWESHHPPGTRASTDKAESHVFKCGQQNTINELLFAEDQFGAAARKDLGLPPLQNNFLLISICN